MEDFNSQNKISWCPGCGNFAIHTSLKKALGDMKLSPSEVFMSFDIGCNGNGADKINLYAFKGLHGRSIPLAVGAHLANRRFTVIADIGDGGCFHEGLDHLVHAIRSNYNITIIIHNNQNFALTTGQATLVTPKKKKMYGLPFGRSERDFNISEFIINLKPTFYAKGYSGDLQQMSEIFKSGIKHKGCSIIEIMQLCPTYNKEFTPQWAKENIVPIENVKKYNNTSIDQARSIVTESKTYTGIIYQNKQEKDFYSSLPTRNKSLTELVDEVKEYDTKKYLKYFK